MMNPSSLHSDTNADSVFIGGLEPSLEGGRYAVKRIAGETVEVSADVFKDGHDALAVDLLWKLSGNDSWQRCPMHHADNDRWTGSFPLAGPGHYDFTVAARPDPFRSWKDEFRRRVDGGQSELGLEIEEGARLIESSARRAAEGGSVEVASDLMGFAATIRGVSTDGVLELADSPDLQVILDIHPDRTLETCFPVTQRVFAGRAKAHISSWYEFFPRCAEGKPAPGSTLKDCVPRLEHAKAMGFDVIYLPPIHPIGTTARKGANNNVTCQPGEPGSPWAIGNKAGGHRAIEPSLGTLEDFDWLVEQARKRGLEIALDFAINCSPDHPYVTEYPEWFHQRPDGSIKYAENPPKKYQDIYPLNFHCNDWRNLWSELTDLVRFWVRRGVQIFRVDNPHTKPIAFWEALIGEIRSENPDVVFLSEAFTKPKMMQALAKVGFDQSYTYFTWRVTKGELIEYLTELTQSEMREYFRGNLWPNTPDILPFHLQNAPEQSFKIRAALAATLSTCWGIYSGYEFCENTPLGPGKEEYLDSEKYQFKVRDWNAPGIRSFLAALNKARRENTAFSNYGGLRFLHTPNDQILAYFRTSHDGSSKVIVVVTLDAFQPQESSVTVPVEELGLPTAAPIPVTDVLTGRSFEWNPGENYVRLDPGQIPLHILKL